MRGQRFLSSIYSDRRIGLRFPVGAENFSLLRRVQFTSEAYPASYPIGTGDHTLRGKEAVTWIWPLTCLLSRGTKYTEQYLHISYIFMMWCLIRVEGAIKARWIITPPEYIASTCVNIGESWPAFCCCEHCVTSTNYQCHLETVEVCLSRLQELKELGVSVATSILNGWIFALSQVKGHSANNNQLILLKFLCKWMPCMLFFLGTILENLFDFF
jgi:hypothetical protein